MNPHPGNKEIHYNEMAHTSQHYENMKHLMRSEILMLCIEDRQLQCVDNTSDGIDDAAGEKPCESGRCESGNDLADRHDAYPAHRDVDHGGEPLREVDPEGIDDDAYDGDAPDKGQHPVAGLISEDDQAHRRVGSGDQDEDHHVVDFPENFVDVFRDVEGVVDRACGVKQDHADDEDAEGL